MNATISFTVAGHGSFGEGSLASDSLGVVSAEDTWGTRVYDVVLMDFAYVSGLHRGGSICTDTINTPPSQRVE